jgi:hypothetical protein
MIKAVRNEVVIIVNISGTMATVELPLIPWQMMETLQPYTTSLELGIERHLQEDYHPNRFQSAVDYLKSEGWEVEYTPDEEDPAPEDVVY